MSGLRTFLASSSPNKKNTHFSYKENTFCEVMKKKGTSFPWHWELDAQTLQNHCSTLLPGPFLCVPWGITNALPSKCLQKKLHVISCVYIYECVHMFIYGVHYAGCSCMHICLEARVQPQMSTLRHCLPVFETRPLTRLESPNRIGCLNRYLLAWIYRRQASIPSFFTWALGNKLSSLCSEGKHFYQESYLHWVFLEEHIIVTKAPVTTS